MVRRALLLVSVLLSVLGGACSGSHSSRCEDICHREANCAEQRPADENDVDESECVEQCKTLERDPDGIQFVEAHENCLASAPTCRAVLACP